MANQLDKHLSGQAIERILAGFGSELPPSYFKAEATHARLIEDYAIVGDCERTAMVGRDGSID